MSKPRFPVIRSRGNLFFNKNKIKSAIFYKNSPRQVSIKFITKNMKLACNMKQE